MAGTLLITSSREGGQPANLQGILNDQNKPAWDSKYTVNIQHRDELLAGREHQHCRNAGATVRRAGGDRRFRRTGPPVSTTTPGGWVLHHNFDPSWRGTAPINASNHGIWPTGGAWLCQNLWQHYLYTGDEDFLRKTGYPLD